MDSVSVVASDFAPKAEESAVRERTQQPRPCHSLGLAQEGLANIDDRMKGLGANYEEDLKYYDEVV